VDDLVRALGLEGVSRKEVSRLCAELDAALKRFRSRPLEGTSPYVWLDAKAVRGRPGWPGDLPGRRGNRGSPREGAT
jgi:putative transposase